MKIHLTLKCFDIFVDILCGLYLCFTGMFPAKIPEPWEAAGVGRAQFFHHIVQQELESEKKWRKNSTIAFRQQSHKYRWKYMCTLTVNVVEMKIYKYIYTNTIVFGNIGARVVRIELHKYKLKFKTQIGLAIFVLLLCYSCVEKAV